MLMRAQFDLVERIGTDTTIAHAVNSTALTNTITTIGKRSGWEVPYRYTSPPNTDALVEGGGGGGC